MDMKALITEVMFGSVNPSTAASSAARVVLYKKGMKQCGNRQILM
jgi:hypothetical protein